MTELKCIWHKAGFHEAIDDKLKVSKDGKWVYWTMYGWNISGEDAHDIGCEWAYLDDLLACEKELIDTKKKLDIAVDALKNMYEIIKNYEYGNGLYYALDSHDTILVAEDVEKALIQINQKEEK